MGKIIICKGLPASGKSTWAKEVVAKSGGKTKRINKDEIRAMIDAGKWSGDREKFVLQFRDNFIQSCMGRGYDVIVDDTNLHPKHVKHIEELVNNFNRKHNEPVDYGEGVFVSLYTVEINDSFLQVPYKECVRRDLARPNSVGEKVIRGMYLQFVLGVERIKQDESLPHCIICDIDGNLSLFKNKNPYDRDFENDEVNIPVRDLVKKCLYNRFNEMLVHPEDIHVIFLSGRSDKYREVTENWIKEKAGLSINDYDAGWELYMRKEGDKRSDMVVKKEMFDTYVKDKYYVDWVLDDRLQVVQLWTSLGLFVFNTNQTNEEF